MTAVFRMENVTKRFGRSVALDDVTIEAPAGSVVALLGENGAGKTTSLRILLGLADADEGQSEVLGLRSDKQSRAIRQRVGYVPDKPALYGWMTVDEMGWFAAGFHGYDYQDQYRRLIRRFELGPHQKLKTLSKGQLAKVSLAVSMASQPELLILDEPTSGLDPMVRRDFLSSMSDIAAEGRTVLLSSHQIHEVERVADIVAILRKGRLVVCERMDELKAAISEVTITLATGAGVPIESLGTLVSQQRQGQQWRALVRGVDEAKLLHLQSRAEVVQLEVRSPWLEEIFVGHMHPDRVPGAGGLWPPVESQLEASESEVAS